jgi:VanZ family protein
VENSAIAAAGPVKTNVNLRLWMPAAIWIVTLFVFSTTIFSAANTGRIIEPILRWIFPAASTTQIVMMHGLVRKSAHFFNYAVLFWLLIRGPMAGRPYAALACCILYAAVDETHQIFVPGRTPSPYDVALDSTGALFSRFLYDAVCELKTVA